MSVPPPDPLTGGPWRSVVRRVRQFSETAGRFEAVLDRVDAIEPWWRAPFLTARTGRPDGMPFRAVIVQNVRVSRSEGPDYFLTLLYRDARSLVQVNYSYGPDVYAWRSADPEQFAWNQSVFATLPLEALDPEDRVRGVTVVQQEDGDPPQALILGLQRPYIKLALPELLRLAEDSDDPGWRDHWLYAAVDLVDRTVDAGVPFQRNVSPELARRVRLGEDPIPALREYELAVEEQRIRVFVAD